MKNLKQYLTIVFSLVLAFSCTNETIEKSELQQINHDFTLYWYMTGCVFATTLFFIFWFILKMLKK